MRKRERENPCGVCGHYHRYEEGEVCGICGHRLPASEDKPIHHASAFPTEILKDFLYLGSYDNASRGELLKALGISRILNTVPACQNLYKNSFTYHCLKDLENLPFDDANQFLEQCEREKARVLVHCMSGKNRSPAIVIAFLMRSRGWRLLQSFQWVKERRPQVELSTEVHEQLVEFERRSLGSNEAVAPSATLVQEAPSFGFEFPNSTGAGPPAGPVFNNPTAASVFQRVGTNGDPTSFVFGAARSSAGSEAPMES